MNINISDMRGEIIRFMSDDPDGVIREEYALRPDVIGIRYFDDPMLGCAAADDPLFRTFRDDSGIIGDFMRLPEDWLNGAVSVVSIFFPFSAAIRDSNRDNIAMPSDEWLHSRMEGHIFLEKILAHTAEWVRTLGAEVAVPSLSPEFAQRPCGGSGKPAFVSNWSERHTAYIAGLGTFGLSRHLITEKGVCGRFGSFITDAYIERTPRAYSDPFEYCSMCGACVKRCPVSAISAENGVVRGKRNDVCKAFLDELKKTTAPRYGCGKCQINVPCETRALKGRSA